MITFCFIILHYQTADDTVACVHSIKRIAPPQETHVLIIDNASPNGSGRKLEDQFREDDRVTVLLNNNNEGFSRANNKACAVAKDRWDPQFYIFCNNDIIFEQEAFCDLLKQVEEETHFSVLGPDIYNPMIGKHQSPQRFELPDIKQINRTIRLNKAALALWPLSYPLLSLWFRRYGDVEQLLWHEKSENAILSGSCIVFSKHYADERNAQIFSPETFFYYEEYILALWCKRHGLKMVYNPALKVLHNDSSATRQSFRKQSDKIRFQMQNIIDAGLVYKDYLLADID